MKVRARSTARAAQAFRALAERYREEVLRAESESAVEALEAAIEQTSGTLSTRQLRRMGHPYALRAPQTPVDPGRSNDQGGGLAQSWQIRPPRLVGDAVETHVVNRHPDARWLKRSTRPGWRGPMVPRPIVAAVLETIQPQRQQRLKAAARAALQSFKEQL